MDFPYLPNNSYQLPCFVYFFFHLAKPGRTPQMKSGWIFRMNFQDGSNNLDPIPPSTLKGVFSHLAPLLSLLYTLNQKRHGLLSHSHVTYHFRGNRLDSLILTNQYLSLSAYVCAYGFLPALKLGVRHESHLRLHTQNRNLPYLQSEMIRA